MIYYLENIWVIFLFYIHLYLVSHKKFSDEKELWVRKGLRNLSLSYDFYDDSGILSFNFQHSPRILGIHKQQGRDVNPGR